MNELVSSIAEFFYSKEPYKNPDRRLGRGLMILFVVTAILFIPGYKRFVIVINGFKQDYIDPLIYQMPVMEVINGEVYSSVDQPYEIFMEGQRLFVLDTTGEITSLEDAQAHAFMGPHHFAVYEDAAQGKIRRIDLSDMDYLVLDPISIKNWSDGVLPFFYPLFFVVSAAGVFIFRLAQTIFFTAAAFFLLKIRGRPLEFRELFFVALYAIIPPMTIETLIMLFPFYLPGQGLLFYIAAAGYIWWAVSAYMEGREQPPAS